MISQEYAKNIGNQFASEICKHLSPKIHNVNVVLPPEGVNVYNMFKGFSIDRSSELGRIAFELER